MTIQERKFKVAELMASEAKHWKNTYGREGIEPTQEEKDEHKIFRKVADEAIKSLIPSSERLSICLSGCAKGDLSHYDMEDTLKMFFKPGEGVQYDSESGQFWMYVKPTLVQQVLRAIDHNFPGQINLVVEPNAYADNPWFQNWTQAERYLETVVGRISA
jgi:hypothetical protein